MRNKYLITNSEGRTKRRIVILLLFACLMVTVSVYADDTETKSTHTKHTKHASNGPNNNESTSVKEPADVQEIDNLTKNIRQTLDFLQKDMEKILTGIRSVAIRKSTIEAEKQTIEILPIQNDTKDQNIASLSEKVKTLANQMADLSTLYKQKAGEFKTLSANLSALDIKRKELIELRAVTGSFKDIDAGNMALNLSSNNNNIDSLHKKIDDVLSGSFTPKADGPGDDGRVAESPEPVVEQVVISKKKPVADAKQLASTVPAWIEDMLTSEGRKINSEDYGPMVVAERNGATVMTVSQAYNDKYKSTFAKFIKESYKSDNTFYYVLGNIDKNR